MKRKNFEAMLLQGYACASYAKLAQQQNGRDEELKTQSQSLVSAYEKLIFKLGLMDLSWAILKKDFFFSSQQATDEECVVLIAKAASMLKSTLQSMKLNKFELSYLGSEFFE